MRSRAIYGCAGQTLSQAEKDFFRDAAALGLHPVRTQHQQTRNKSVH